MFRHLHTRLAAALFAILVVLGLLYLASTRWTTRLYVQEVEQKLNADLAESIVSEQPLLQDGEVHRPGLEELFHMLMVVNPGIEVYLLDPRGEILAYSAPPEKVRRQRVDLAPVKALLAGEEPLPILGDDPRSPDRRKVFSAAPIPLEGPPEGYLYIVLGGERYDSAAGMLEGSYILRLATGLALASLLLAVGVGLVLFRRLTAPLRRLEGRMIRFGDSAAAAGQAPADEEADEDEVASLEAAFDEMARRIEAQVAELQRLDRTRRELVANVSHDLRTPLAAVGGYLETLVLRKDRLSGAEREEYLGLALHHAERLGRRVGELFELATLDAREDEPAREEFSLAELVHDNLQKLHLRARENGVALSVEHPEDLPPVSADIGLIERVLDNLLDNAIRFTPEGGSVTVLLARRDGEVEVRVRDTGCGIPEGEIPRIFDRLYRSPYAGGRETDGAGLGLAISARILELHQRRIEVESTPGRGTTFRFSLPAA